MEPIAIGDVLDGKYVIEGMLGEGAMGVVFSARHRALNKMVAVKTLRAEIAQDQGLVGRFEQEARAASAIGHPNIIEVFDLGSAPNGARYMVMEYLTGESLADIITSRPYQTAERAVFLMAQVLSALGAAHKQGIIHRDLKPENIFVVRTDERPETVKLLDFGISKVLSEIADPRIAGTNSDARATRLGMVMGTPLYMAPEQARGLLDLDHRVDLWAVAVVLYELMCGRPPFDGENYNQILGAILQGELLPPRTYCPQIAPALEAVIMRGLAYDRADRFQSAAEMRQALEAASTEPAAPPPDPGRATAALAPQRPVPPLAIASPPADALELEGPMSDALSIAGRGSAADEAALLSAMERIAGGDAAIGLGPAAEPEPPRPAPAQPAAPTDSRPPRDAGRGADDAHRFAPPASQSEELALDLAEPSAAGAVKHRAREAAAAVDHRPRARATTVARGPGVSLGKLLAGVLLLAALGAGGFAGYRYATKGYLLSPPAKPRLSIQVTTTPAEAELRVDGIAVPGRSFELAPGASARVRAVAPGRVSREVVIVAGDPAEPVVLALPHRLGPSSLHVAAERDDRHGPAAAAGEAVLDGALAKLAQYTDCLIPLTTELAAVREEYRRVTRGSAGNIKRNNVPALRPLSIEAVTTCRASLDAAPAAPPRFPAIDEPARSLMSAVDELGVLLEDLGGYYTQERYFNDDLKYGRKMHRALSQAIDASWDTAAPLAAAVAERRAYWQRVELEAIARREGESAHWQLRRLALALQRWQGAVSRHGLGKARADEVRATLDQVLAYAAEHAAEMDEVEGADAYLAGVKVLLERLAGGKVSVAEAFDLGNACIADFNAMVL